MPKSTFTTYLNVAEDRASEAAFDRLAQKAVGAYATISRAADDASRATAGLIAGRGSAGLGTAINSNLRQRATEMRNLGTASERVGVQSDRTGRAIRAEGVEAERSAIKHGRLADSLRSTAAGLQVVQGPLGPLAGRVTAVANALETLTGFRLGLVGLGTALFGLARVGNEYSTLQSKLTPFFDSQKQVNTAMNDIVGIATRSKAALEPVVDLYSRLTVVGRDVGLSQARISRLTETASKAASLSGGTEQARSGALTQFSQAVGGNFRGAGQELQSLAEGAPVLLAAIAKGFKNTDGSIGVTIGQLRKLAEEGKVTTLAVADALDRVASDIDKKSAKIEARITTAGTAVRNAFVIDIGRFDQAIGFSNTLAQALTLVAGNMREVLTLGVGIAGAFAGIKLVNFGKDLASQASGFINTQRQVKALDAAWLEEAAAAKIATTATVTGLEAQRLEIAYNIYELERLTQAQTAAVVAAQTKLSRAPAGGKGALLAQADLTRANEELRYTTNQLVRAQDEQRGVVTKLGPAYQAASDATERHGAVVLETGKRVGIFKSAATGLVSFLGGPWGIAFGIATAALTYLATAESNAERATRLHENAQRDFASILDATTGKIYSQVSALEILAKKKTVSESLAANRDEVTSARESLRKAISVGANKNDPEQVRAAATLQALYRRLTPTNADTPSFAELSKTLTPLVEKYKGLNQVPAAFTKYREAVERVNKDRAALRIGTAQERRTDVAVVTGRLTPSQAQAQPIKTKTQLDREAAALANSGSGDVRKQAAGRRDQALLDLEGRFPKGGATAADQKQYLDARRQILATYDSEIKGITDAKHAASVAARDARHNAAEAKKDAAEADRVRRQKAEDDANEKASNALADLEERRGLLTTQAYKNERVAILQTQDDELNAARKRGDASAKANAQELRDTREIGAARKQIADEIDHENQVNQLLLQGRDAEANALQRTLELVDRIGDAGYAEYNTLLRQELAHERINDVLQSRGRIVDAYTGILDTARDGFEQFLTDLPDKGARAGLDYIKSVQRSIFAASARSVTEQLFAGADEKLRNLINGGNSVQGATTRFAGQVETTSGQTRKLGDTMATVADQVAQAGKELTASISNFGQAPAGAQRTGLVGQETLDFIADRVDQEQGPSAAEGDEITVTARPQKAETAKPIDLSIADYQSMMRVGPQAFQGGVGAQIFQTVGGKLDKVVDKLRGRTPVLGEDGQQLKDISGKGTVYKKDGTITTGSEFFSKMGKTFGTALEGAGNGAFANSLFKPLAKALGVKTSSTGASLGGAAGQLAFGPIGGFVGGIVGSVIGGLFKKTPTGSVSISNTGVSTSGKLGGQLAQSGGAVQSALDNIVQQLGGTLGQYNVAIGKRGDEYRVSASGNEYYATKKKTGADIIYKGDDPEEAAKYATLNAIQDGAIQGIRAGAQQLLQAGKDLDSALNKALKFQNVFDRLKQRTEPVVFAVEQLNKQYVELLGIFKEAGASTQDYADLQKLYDLERADSIKQATNAAASAIDQFIKDMTGSSNSPLNKLDTYQSAASTLGAYRADIAGGKVVDQNELLAAARNFQDASRSLNGSSEAFFADFEDLRSLLSRARDNAGITNVANLPGSPLDTDSSVQAALAALGKTTAAATSGQTADLLKGLDAVKLAVERLAANGSYGSGGGGSSFGGLPGYNNVRSV